MTIGSLVCRSGVGPNATIGLFVTHGLISGNTPPPITKTGGHDLPRHLVEEYRKKLKALELKKRELEAEKLERTEHLRALLQNKGHILPDETEKEPIIQELLPELPKVERQQAKTYIEDVKSLNEQLVSLQKQIEAEADRLQDEEDIQIILQSLTIH